MPSLGEGGAVITLRIRPSVEMATIIHKFEWARDGEWSVPISPKEAGIMSRLIDHYFHLLNYQPPRPPSPEIEPRPETLAAYYDRTKDSKQRSLRRLGQ